MFNDISTFVVYLMSKPFLPNYSSGYFLIHIWGHKEVHTFPKGIRPKVITVERLAIIAI